jgi:hypothetical protein
MGSTTQINDVVSSYTSDPHRRTRYGLARVDVDDSTLHGSAG